MPSHSHESTRQVDRARTSGPTMLSDVTGDCSGTPDSVVSDAMGEVLERHGRAEVARRWNELVRGYSAPGTDTLLYLVPDRIQRPLGPAARKERARIDGLLRRQAHATTGIATGTLGVLGGATVADSPLLALAAGLATAVTGVVSLARWRRLGDRRTTLTTTDAHNTWQMTRFSRWLVARAHQATLRATEVDGGPIDTADRMAESLYQFTADVRTLERIIASSSTIADTYGRLRHVRGQRDQVDTLLDAQRLTLRALNQFECTAREVVLAAHAERAVGERADVVASLLDLQAEALTRRDALAALAETVSQPPDHSA